MRRDHERLSAPAPAKVNLFLNITGRNNAGYHLLESFFALVDGLADEVMVTYNDELTVQFVNFLTLPTAENIVLKAAHLLRQHFAVHQGANIIIHKNIPVAAGLGGGSSDVATTLKLLAKLWNINCSTEDLAQLGLQIGADVPFFIHGRNALVKGIGEIIMPASLGMGKKYMLLVNPRVASSTVQIFNQYKQLGAYFTPSFGEYPPVIAQWKNDLQEAACQINPVITNVLAMLRQAQGCEFAGMSGSGATCFAIFSSQVEAQKTRNWIEYRQPQWFFHEQLLEL